MVCPHSYRTRRHPIRPKRDGPIELVCFDMDGVLIHGGSSWVLVHRYFGVHNEAGYARYMAGEINDEEFIRTDVALWTRTGPVHDSLIDAIMGTPQLAIGARETVDALHAAGVRAAIVSGGLEHMAHKVAKLVGIDEVHANGLETDDEGFLTGEGILRTPLHDKSEPLLAVAERFGVPRSRVAAVGDSCPDQSMFEASGLAIAFNPADKCIAHVADHVVNGPDLRAILPFVR